VGGLYCLTSAATVSSAIKNDKSDDL
jgi:hypothetical protein